ncbi:Neurensin-1 [Dissostichus eleginoides]|uniref:Neurensin-1 n=1 Tax=Dissostichus eleginoides TaxID=100907 RepID=A0AAD9EWM7_DISEL|nr:Neurensin-1 [Dissostichus eleginoides]
MALCSDASGGESSGSEASSSCLQFGVRSYLHHFYEECSSSMWDKNPEDQGVVQSQRKNLRWSAAVLKVSMAFSFLLLTAGITSLSVGYSTPHKMESFGEGDLFFVDKQAVSFNKSLNISSTAGIWLTCLGSALLVMGVFVWILQRKANLKEKLFYKQGERRGDLGSKWRGIRDLNVDVVTNPTGVEKGKIPVTLSKVEKIQLL